MSSSTPVMALETAGGPETHRALPGKDDEARRTAAENFPLPLVLVDQPPGEELSSVNVDDRAGARAAATHLLELGHRRITLVVAGPEVLAAPDDWYVPRERLRGWLDALQTSGVSPVVRAAESLGLRVPADLSVVGFDDSPLADRVTPALTTVRQDVVAKGAIAATELVAAVRGRRTGTEAPAAHHLLTAELVVRESTAPPCDEVHGTNRTFAG